jgi:AcrR family transcriptional regulator
MARPPDVARRRELLDAVIAAFASGGIGGRSLRDIAEAAGSSHRMLIHHFGSRDELLLAVVVEVERRQTELVAELPLDPGDAFMAMWASVRRPELRPFERLFFECYSRGAQGEEPFARLLPGAIDDWMTAAFERAPAADPALVRLQLAVTRGLLLDLVATNDAIGVDAAATRFAQSLRFRSRSKESR